jgi:hypothetical protein
MIARGFGADELIRRLASVLPDRGPAGPVQNGIGPLEQTVAGLDRLAPRCPGCAMPVGTGTARVYEGGEFYHASCRSLRIARAALQQYGAGDDGPAVEASGTTAGSAEANRRR